VIKLARYYDESQKKATAKYNAKAYDDIKIRAAKGKREEYKAFAESKGMSLNAWAISLMEKDMEQG
jgi:predicted HicB family RNase H-like nuclease